MTKTKIIFLKDAKNLQELKKLYFQFSKKMHPDVGGKLEDMQQLNNEYDYLKTILKNDINPETKKAYTENNASMDAFRNIIDELMKYNKITIEIVGSWLWISGQGTFTIKDEILYNKLHCKYSKTNKKFYWFSGIENNTFKCKGGYLKQAIDKYGITKIESELKPELQ
jgi:hypothetical protein